MSDRDPWELIDRRREVDLDQHLTPRDPADTEREDDMFPEWDAAAELADDARRGK